MPARYFKDQYDDETVLMLFRRHIVVMRRQLLVAAALISLAAVSVLVHRNPDWQYFWSALGVGSVLGGLVFMYGWMSWYHSVFIVTDKRLIQITQQGFFNKSVVDINLQQIQMVNYQVKGFQETLLGFGTLSIQTMVGELSIETVARPAKVQRDLSRILKDKVKISGGSQSYETN